MNGFNDSSSEMIRKVIAPVAIAFLVFGAAIYPLSQNQARADQLIYTCTAETAHDNGGIDISDQVLCTVPSGATITSAILDWTLDDGGNISVNDQGILSRPATVGIKSDRTPVTVSLSGGQDFSLRVDAQNAMDENQNPVGDLYGRATLELYGTFGPPATHFACQNNACVSVSGAGSNTCTTNNDCAAATHHECQNNACVSVSGSGPNQCSSNNDCAAATHFACQNNACVSVSGAGPNQCTTNNDCAPATHFACQNNACVSVSGAGPNTCTSNNDCAPSNQAPQGYLDAANCTLIGGWASDPDTAGQPVTVQIFDGPRESGTLVQTTIANLFRADVGNKAYNIATPQSLKNGVNHDIYAYALDTSNGQPTLLTGSPKSFTCNTASITADIKANGSDGPITIQQGTSANITWTSTNASQCTVSPTGWTGTSGSQTTGSLSNSQTYTLNCTGAAGSATDSVTVNVQQQGTLTCSPSNQNVGINQSVTLTASGGNGTYSWSGGGNPPNGSGSSFTTSFSNSGTQNVTVMSGTQSAQCYVNVSQNNPTVDIKANGSDGPVNISSGESANITWTSQNTSFCSISPTGWTGTGGTHQTGPLYTSQTYTANCTGLNGTQVSDSVTVFVNQNNNLPTVTLTANPSSISPGQSSNLSWYSSNANSCYASGGWFGNKQLSGNELVYPQITTTYTITCSNQYGMASDSKTVFVNSNPCQFGNCPCQFGNCNATNLTLTKTVLNRTLNQTVYSTSVDAQSLDILEFEIRVRNTDMNSGSVTVRDTLPTEMYYVPNSTTVDGMQVQDGITSSGLSLGSVSPQQEKVIHFRAVVFAGISDRTVTNQVNASMNTGVQNAYATVNIRSRGQVLGAANIVTGPEDPLPWILFLGFLGSILSYLVMFKLRLVNLPVTGSAGPKSDLQELVLELRAREGRPDTA